MGVHDGHRDRLRARFLKSGLEHFEPHTALELLLFYGRPRCDTNELAHALINRFGSFAAVVDAPMEELLKVKGVGVPTATLLKMVPEFGSYYYASRSQPGRILDSSEKAGDFFMPLFMGRTNEELYIACLDDTRKVIRCNKVAEGITNAVRISVKQIVSEAVCANATGVILAHNHPGGLALPSPADRSFTQQCYTALKYINIYLMDHIVVAGDDFVSMADSGFMTLIEQEAE